VIEPKDPHNCRSNHHTHHDLVERALWVAFFLNLVFLIIEVAIGLWTNSLALLSESGHAFVDTGATALTFFAVREAEKPADEEHHYGHGKYEALAALIEAQNQAELNRVRNRWLRYELIVIDEMGYVMMPDTAAELLFQVIAGRAERAAVIVTTNLPFSEWTTKFPNARLCKAMLDRLTDQAHIIETGNESYRFRRTLEKKHGKGARA
jgi:hypothetical protein